MDNKNYTYFIKQKDTGLFYYGVKYSKDANPDLFWVDYFTSSRYVHELIEKYGKESFDIQIRKTFEYPRQALEWEQKVISKIRTWDNCLNISLGGDAIRSHKNRHIKDVEGLSSYDRAILKSTETCKENGWYDTLSNKMKGKQIGIMHKCEHCGKTVVGGNFKRWHGDNCKMNLNITQEQLDKRKPANFGKPMKDEQKRKISDSRKGIPLSDEHKEAVSESLKGRKFTKESRDKLSKSLTGRVFSEEHRRKLSESARQRKKNNL